MFERNHYIQKGLLKNFSNLSENNKYKICVLDLIKFSVSLKNIESAFYEQNLYDTNFNYDKKELEKNLNKLIEEPALKLIKKICTCSKEVIFTRKELSIIKKYFLLQRYRTPKNKRSYTDTINGFKFSNYNITKNELEEDFWKREMLTILNSNWNDLLKSEMIGVRKHASDVNSSFIIIIKSNSEFCINDIGYVTERIPYNIPKSKRNDYIKKSKEIGKILYGKDNFDEIAIKEIEDQNSYIDNFELYPISSNYAILFVPQIWKIALYNPQIIKEIPLNSPFLTKYLVPPKNKYINKDKIKKQEDIEKYMDDNDEFIYSIQTITEEETIYLNMLTMNEAYCYIGVKNPKNIIPSIKKYNYLMSIGKTNMHHNYNGFVDLLLKL